MTQMPKGFKLVSDPLYRIRRNDIYLGPSIGGQWVKCNRTIGMLGNELRPGSCLATPEVDPQVTTQVATKVTLSATELADNIARAIQPQMSVDAKNGNDVAVRGLDYISGIVAKELAKFKISSHETRLSSHRHLV